MQKKGRRRSLVLVGLVDEPARIAGLLTIGASLEDGLVILNGPLALAQAVAAVSGSYQGAALELDASRGAPGSLLIGLSRFIEVALRIQALAQSKVGQVEMSGGEIAGLRGLIDERAVGGRGVHATARFPA